MAALRRLWSVRRRRPRFVAGSLALLAFLLAGLAGCRVAEATRDGERVARLPRRYRRLR